MTVGCMCAYSRFDEKNVVNFGVCTIIIIIIAVLRACATWKKKTAIISANDNIIIGHLPNLLWCPYGSVMVNSEIYSNYIHART